MSVVRERVNLNLQECVGFTKIKRRNTESGEAFLFFIFLCVLFCFLFLHPTIPQSPLCVYWYALVEARIVPESLLGHPRRAHSRDFILVPLSSK